MAGKEWLHGGQIVAEKWQNQTNGARKAVIDWRRLGRQTIAGWQRTSSWLAHWLLLPV